MYISFFGLRVSHDRPHRKYMRQDIDDIFEWLMRASGISHESTYEQIFSR